MAITISFWGKAYKPYMVNCGRLYLNEQKKMHMHGGYKHLVFTKLPRLHLCRSSAYTFNESQVYCSYQGLHLNQSQSLHPWLISYTCCPCSHTQLKLYAKPAPKQEHVVLIELPSVFQLQIRGWLVALKIPRRSNCSCLFCFMGLDDSVFFLQHI